MKIHKNKKEYDSNAKAKRAVVLGTHKLSLCREEKESLCIKVTVGKSDDWFIAFKDATQRMEAYASLEAAQNVNRSKIHPTKFSFCLFNK